MKPRYKDIFSFQISIWIIAFNVFGLIRILTTPNPFEIPMLKASSNIFQYILVNTLAGIIMGALLSIVDIFLLYKIKKKHTFGYFFIRKSIAYIFTIIFVLTLVLALNNLFYGTILQDSTSTYLPRIYLGYLIFALLVSVLIGFLSQVNDKFGPGILLPMFLGKYHNPREEEKILMFIDLTSSTTHAERLGHIQYSYMIQDFLFDMNIAANEHEGEIYQYVGDEAIITWDLKKGILKENCLSVINTFKEIINNKSEYYSTKYGGVPTFKAGVNAGKVMVAEVGYLKKEIAYHGDTINTAARIRGLCNEYRKEFLTSENVVKLFKDSVNFSFSSMGILPLKGKKKEVEIFSVDTLN